MQRHKEAINAAQMRLACIKMSSGTANKKKGGQSAAEANQSRFLLTIWDAGMAAGAKEPNANS